MAEDEKPLKRYAAPRDSDGRHFLTLVDLEYLRSMGNIPAAAWEPLSYLYSEATEAKNRLGKLECPPQFEQLRKITLGKWGRVISWLDNLLIESGSVKALRSGQMVQSFQGAPEQRSNALATVTPNVQGQEGTRRNRLGLRRR